MRTIVIFHFDRDGWKSLLELHADETVTFHTSNYGWTARKYGCANSIERLSVIEAKVRWPSRARKIDKALKKLATRAPPFAADRGAGP